MTWHHFTVSSDDDNECANTDCGVIVSDEALRTLNVPCPAPACEEAVNGGPCVFVPGETGPVCSYCERPGYRDVDDEDEYDLDDEDAA